MRKKKAGELLKKYADAKSTPAEDSLMEKVFREEAGENPEVYSEDELETVTQSAWSVVSTRTTPKTRKVWPYVAAAASLLIIGLSYFASQYRPSLSHDTPTMILTDVGPGGNKATLYLSNGSKINLTSTSTGLIAQQSGMNILKTKEGELEYQETDNHDYESHETKNNVIVTPRGGQYTLKLPDGTKVWLNAASSMKFPTTFDRQQSRTVVLSGEAYFEVAKDASRPFIVETPNQRVTVLGTHFNVNAYPDEKETQTTLLEGSVEVFSTELNLSKVLTPHQMAIHQSKELIVLNVDESEVVAWKNGKMNFNETDLPTLMREVSRWYDLDIIYPENIGIRKFSGGIKRNTNLSTLLEILKASASDLNFIIEQGPQGKRLIVKSN